jgi:putative flippase GtrA
MAEDPHDRSQLPDVLPNESPPASQPSGVRHIGGFLAAGVLAFATDAGLLRLITSSFAVSPFAARPFTIFSAMLVSWWLNRTITFPTARAPSVREFAGFAMASFGGQVVNYGVFAAILTAWPSTDQTLAIVLASAVAMFVTYAGLRFGVFSKSN